MTIALAIDASNIRAGGGLTHLQQLLAAAEPRAAGIERITVWGGGTTLGALERRPWLDAVQVPALDGALPARLLWQQRELPALVKNAGCKALFSPGGTIPLLGSFPKITMSQNLLPFEPREAARFGRASAMRLKQWLLRRSQTASFRRAEGVVFLTEYARRAVLDRTGPLGARTVMIPHGIEERFFMPLRGGSSRALAAASPFRVLYVSIIDGYKHQWHVARAIALARAMGVPAELELIGPARPPALRRLRDAMQEVDPAGEFVSYTGPVPFEELHEKYRRADAFVFASSCENLPNILLEAMAAGLPIACSDRGPMPEVLGAAGVYFDPERPDSIARAVQALYLDGELRARIAADAQQRARSFTWARCAAETLAFCSTFFD